MELAVIQFVPTAPYFVTGHHLKDPHPIVSHTLVIPEFLLPLLLSMFFFPTTIPQQAGGLLNDTQKPSASNGEARAGFCHLPTDMSHSHAV